MDNLIEKITLYDILAYAFSGFMFLLIAGYGRWESFLQTGETEGGLTIPVFLLILVSYFMGILMSELSALAICLLNAGWTRKVRERLVRAFPALEKIVLKRRGQESVGVLGSGVSEETVVNALIASKAEKSPEKIRKKGIENYVPYMYGIIQVIPEYKRIHNYASAFVLYKNLSAAVCSGCLVLFLSGRFTWREALAAGIVLVLLIIRAVRFYKKKNRYAIIWFVDKYMGR